MNSSALNKLKSQTEKIAWITFFWILISVSKFVMGYGKMLQFDCVDEEINIKVGRSVFSGFWTECLFA